MKTRLNALRVHNYRLKTSAESMRFRHNPYHHKPLFKKRISRVDSWEQNKQFKEQRIEFQKLYRKYKTIFEYSVDPIIVCEIKNHGSYGRIIVEVNEAAIEHFGYAKDELLLHDTSFLHHNTEIDTLLPKIGQELLEKHHSFFEAKHRKRNGDTVDVEVHSTVIAIDDFLFSISVIRDISKRKELERRSLELCKAEKGVRQELEKQIQHRTEFYRALVHELKTPLTPIAIDSELLMENLDGEHKKWAENINVAGLELLARINELYDLAKGEVRTLKIYRSWINLYNLINELTELYAPNLIFKELSLKTFFSPDLPQIYADPNRLKQVLTNLLNNSIRFSPKKGQITLFVTHSLEEIIIDVMDEGAGISDDDLQQLFKPYVITRSGGLGLGLSLSKYIVELHNGDIQVESLLGWGSKFSIILPVCKRVKVSDE